MPGNVAPCWCWVDEVGIGEDRDTLVHTRVRARWPQGRRFDVEPSLTRCAYVCSSLATWVAGKVRSSVVGRGWRLAGEVYDGRSDHTKGTACWRCRAPAATTYGERVGGVSGHPG